MDIQQETLEAVDLELFKLQFKESVGMKLTPFEVGYRLQLINILRRLKREKEYKEVLSQ